MSTIGALIDRIHREFLSPLDDSMMSVPLTSGITDSDTSAVYDDGYLTVEDEDMLDIGGRIQLGRELILVSAINTTTRTLTLVRGVLGTTAAAHSAGDLIYIDPPYTRQAVYDAIGEAIPALEPRLYQLGSEEIWSPQYAEELEAGAFEVIETKYSEDGRWYQGGGGIITKNDPDTSTGTSVQLIEPYGTRNLVRYKKSFDSITDETTTLSSIGLTGEMEYVVILGAVARVLAGIDVKPATQEYISQMLESQGFRPGAGSELRNNLLTYQDYLTRNIHDKLVQRDSASEVVWLEPYPGAFS